MVSQSRRDKGTAVTTPDDMRWRVTVWPVEQCYTAEGYADDEQLGGAEYCCITMAPNRDAARLTVVRNGLVPTHFWHGKPRYFDQTERFPRVIDESVLLIPSGISGEPDEVDYTLVCIAEALGPDDPAPYVD